MRDKFTPPFAVLIDDIKLDIKNFRYYGEVSSQRECIAAMLSDPKSRMYALAKDIAENGLTPDPIVLSKDEQENWIVREGNRRIAALKILGNPSIISDKSVRSKFASIAKKHRTKIPESVGCIACENEECILEYLDRLHTGIREGTGRITWSPENKYQYDMHRGRPGANALAIKVKDLVLKEGASLKEPYYITNLQRVLQNKGVQSKLKYAWDGKDITTSIDQKTLMTIMKEIAERVSTTVVDDIYVAKKQQAFVDKVLKDLDLDIDSAKTEPYVLIPDKKEEKKVGRRVGRVPSKPSWDRKRLINPKNTRLNIPDLADNIKARNIFNELARKIDVREAPNAAAVLLRVLLEMSVNRYISSNKLKTKDDSLARGIKNAANHMNRDGKITKQYHDEIIRIGDYQNLFSARTLQRFVHSFDFNPDRQVLCTLWDNIDRFVSICWK